MKRITPIILFIAIVALVALIAPGSAAGSGGVHGYISGRVTPVHNVSASEISVVLVNASNTSEEIAGFNTTCDALGYFQFLDVPNGTYNAFAWGPHLSAGLSNNVTVADNVTYWCSVVLVPEPYYGNITATRHAIYPGETTELTITVYDYWENPVGPDKMVSLHIVDGSPADLNPPYGLTDANSQFKSILTAPENGSFTELQEFAQGWNGTYYPLQKRIEAVTVITPTPTAQPTATPTAAPNATATPTIAPNATATPTASASPTVTAKPTPGFEIAAFALAFGTAAIAFRKK